MGKVLLEEEVGYKEYRFELVQTCSDQSLGRKTVAAEHWTMGWESHLHRIHLCAALTGSSLRTSRPVQLVRDKLFHGPVDGAGVGGIHQSLNVDNPVYKQWTIRDMSVEQVSLDPGCNMWSQQNLNRKWQGQRPEEERHSSTKVSCIWARIKQMLAIL